MAPPQHIFTAQDPPFDLFHLLYNNTSNLHLCHLDLYPIHVPHSIMHTHHYNNKLNNHRLYNNNNNNRHNNNSQNPFITLKMSLSLIHLRGIGYTH